MTISQNDQLVFQQQVWILEFVLKRQMKQYLNVPQAQHVGCYLFLYVWNIQPQLWKYVFHHNTHYKKHSISEKWSLHT